MDVSRVASYLHVCKMLHKVSSTNILEHCHSNFVAEPASGYTYNVPVSELMQHQKELAGPKILAFVSHCSANFQPILDCFIPNFNYEDSKNIKADRVKYSRFQLTSNQT